MNENYEKYRKAVTILLIIVVFSGIWTIIFKAKYENIKNSYVSETGVYTPSGIPDEYHNELSIDIFEYWIYELNESEQRKIEKDLDSGYWIPGSYSILWKFGFEEEADDESECYTCCYDVRNECFVRVRDTNNYPSPCIIYFYDTVTHYYYCVHWSM